MNRFWSDEFVSPASLRAVAAAGSSSRGLREMREMRFMKCALWNALYEMRFMMVLICKILHLFIFVKNSDIFKRIKSFNC